MSLISHLIQLIIPLFTFSIALSPFPCSQPILFKSLDPYGTPSHLLHSGGTAHFLDCSCQPCFGIQNDNESTVLPENANKNWSSTVKMASFTTHRSIWHIHTQWDAEKIGTTSETAPPFYASTGPIIGENETCPGIDGDLCPLNSSLGQTIWFCGSMQPFVPNCREEADVYKEAMDIRWKIPVDSTGHHLDKDMEGICGNKDVYMAFGDQRLSMYDIVPVSLNNSDPITLHLKTAPGFCSKFNASCHFYGYNETYNAILSLKGSCEKGWTIAKEDFSSWREHLVCKVERIGSQGQALVMGADLIPEEIIYTDRCLFPPWVLPQEGKEPKSASECTLPEDPLSAQFCSHSTNGTNGQTLTFRSKPTVTTPTAVEATVEPIDASQVLRFMAPGIVIALVFGAVVTVMVFFFPATIGFGPYLVTDYTKGNSRFTPYKETVTGGIVQKKEGKDQPGEPKTPRMPKKPTFYQRWMAEQQWNHFVDGKGIPPPGADGDIDAHSMDNQLQVFYFGDPDDPPPPFLDMVNQKRLERHAQTESMDQKTIKRNVYVSLIKDLVGTRNTQENIERAVDKAMFGTGAQHQDQQSGMMSVIPSGMSAMPSSLGLERTDKGLEDPKTSSTQ